MLTVHILASGSEGNCLLVSAGGTHLLVDAGISARRICGVLQALALSPADISGVLLTHEHTDHICGVATLTKQHRLPLYASRGTAEALCRKSSCVSDVLRVIPRAGAFNIGNAQITVFPTSHDAAESIDFRVDHDGASIGILTDTGFVTPEAEQTLAGVDLMVLESNHDEVPKNPAQTPAAFTGAQLKQAVDEMNACKSRAQVLSVWKRYTVMQNNNEFRNACIEMGKKYPEKK